ncbi:hypothetical protein SLA2020_066690 [Shorea laevis]
MDTNNGRHNAPNGVPINGRLDAPNGVDTTDWRTQLPPDGRQRIVNKIIETLRRHRPSSGDDELRNDAVEFEDRTYTAASSQSDYLRRISLRMLTLETRSQSNPPDPGSASTSQEQGDSES